MVNREHHKSQYSVVKSSTTVRLIAGEFTTHLCVIVRPFSVVSVWFQCGYLYLRAEPGSPRVK